MSCLAGPEGLFSHVSKRSGIDIALPNVAHMQTRPPRPDRREVDLRRLVAGFLRMAPDVAIVGEVRDRDPVPIFAMPTLSPRRMVAGLTTVTPIIQRHIGVMPHLVMTASEWGTLPRRMFCHDVIRLVSKGCPMRPFRGGWQER
jgi:hypothetical protein